MTHPISDTSPTRFEILGPLRVQRGDIELNLGPIQQRVVLAVLLLHANHPMRHEDLIEGVWGHEAPAYAVNLVQKHVSNLRRMLEPGRSSRTPSEWLPWAEAGYRLKVPAGGLDLDRFELEVARARTVSDPATVATTLRGALTLWRGTVCEGLTGPLVEAERERLAERRITVLEDCIDAELASGGHPDPVAELRRLIAGNPLRERLRGLLMLALYRSGRPADALAVYHETRRHLVEELGIEPGESLRTLHERILAVDPTLLGPPATVEIQAPEPRPASAPVVNQRATPAPAQLPYGVPEIAGRRAEIARLDALATEPGGQARIAIITGTAGVGKTTLAVRWAHAIRDRFPDGQLYVNLLGFDPAQAPMAPAEAILGFLDALGVPAAQIPASVQARAALYRSVLSDRRMLILLDNARDAEQIRPLLTGATGCLVVVTSRDQMPGLVAEGAQPVVLDLLSTDESVDLLAMRLGRDRVAAEPSAVADIVVRCARLPLALSIVASRAALHPGFPLAALAEQLRAAEGSLDAFDPGDRGTDVRAVISWSYRALNDAAARTLRLLSLHPGPDIGVAAVASLAGVAVRDAAVALGALARAHLVDEYTPGRFVVHDLLRVYAAERMLCDETDGARRLALRRMYEHYLVGAMRADHALRRRSEPAMEPIATPGVTRECLSTPERAAAWLAAENAVLLALADQVGAGVSDTDDHPAAGLVRFISRQHDSVASLAASAVS